MRTRLSDFLIDIKIYYPLMRFQEKLKMRSRLEFYSHLMRKGDLVFDVGANHGNRANVFLHLGAKVVAIEPQLNCTEYLLKRFNNHPNFFLVRAALGDHKGESKIKISHYDGISSMSEEWLRAVKASGRFPGANWNKSEKITLTKLDDLIESYGLPSFAKIDVEGYELEVFHGLSKQIPALSFEFTPERILPTISSIRYLSELGYYKFNYSIAESMIFELENWVTSEEIQRILSTSLDRTSYGDIYCKLSSVD